MNFTRWTLTKNTSAYYFEQQTWQRYDVSLLFPLQTLWGFYDMFPGYHNSKLPPISVSPVNESKQKHTTSQRLHQFRQ